MRKNNRNIPWWTQDLAERRRKVRRLFNAANKSGNWTDYKRNLTDYNKDRPRETYGQDTVRRSRRLQNVPDSIGFFQRVGRVQSASSSLKMEHKLQKRKGPPKSYYGSTSLVQK
jgi:hypothetical protein